MAKRTNITKLYPIEGLQWLNFNPQLLSQQGILISIRKDKSASERSRLKSQQFLLSMQQLVDYIISQAVISGDKWGIRDNGIDQNVLRSHLNFGGTGVSISDDTINDQLNITIPADMEKFIYDFDDDGSVELADNLQGAFTAGNLKYYGTDGLGVPGFYDNSGAVAGHLIRSQQYQPSTGTSNDTPFDQRLTMDFGPEFNLEDSIAEDRTKILETVYATSLDAFIPSVEVGGIVAGTAVGAIRGKTYYEMFNDMVFPVIPPVYIDPIVTLDVVILTTSQFTIDPLAANNYLKTGFPLVVRFTSTYIQNDGGGLTFYRLKEDGASIDSSATGTQHIFDFNFQKFVPGQGYSLQFIYHTEFDFDEGPQLPDSHGNLSGDPPGPDTQLSSQIIVDVIYPYYYGVSASKLPTPVEIATATEVVLPNGEQLELPAVSSITEFFFVAIPLSSPNQYPFWHLNDGNSGKVLAGNFIENNTIVLEDPDGFFVSTPYAIYSTPYPNEIDGILTLSTTDEYQTP